MFGSYLDDRIVLWENLGIFVDDALSPFLHLKCTLILVGENKEEVLLMVQLHFSREMTHYFLSP